MSVQRTTDNNNADARDRQSSSVEMARKNSAPSGEETKEEMLQVRSLYLEFLCACDATTTHVNWLCQKQQNVAFAVGFVVTFVQMFLTEFGRSHQCRPRLSAALECIMSPRR